MIKTRLELKLTLKSNTMNNNNHFFNIKMAQEIGIHGAIIYQNICYWVDKNKANDKSFHDGEHWTYNSVQAFQELFPYMSSYQIRKALDGLEKAEYIQSGVFNKSKYDRTKWYTVKARENAETLICSKPQINLFKTTNQFVQNHGPIPDINTYIEKSKPKKNYAGFESRELQIDDLRKLYENLCNEQFKMSDLKTEHLSQLILTLWRTYRKQYLNKPFNQKRLSANTIQNVKKLISQGYMFADFISVFQQVFKEQNIFQHFQLKPDKCLDEDRFVEFLNASDGKTLVYGKKDKKGKSDGSLRYGEL